jgi:cellulose synthase/poly-beta-1,6-N-acetylglucosamine synthase-like glycosyltransferase
VILATAPQAVAHAYAVLARVHVVADGLSPATVRELRAAGAEVQEVSFIKSTKGQALRVALHALPPNAYDVALVLDVDNVMAPSFLTALNQAFAAGYRVVQGHRTAQNLDSPFAVLDACNEEINNHLFRQGAAALGLSSSLIGSGMAFEFGYLRELLAHIGETAGEDKELEFRLAHDRVKVAYLPNAYVYDEKIPNAKVFTTQRTRWLALQLEFLRRYFTESWRQLAVGNAGFFHKTMQTLLVPRLLLLGLLSALLPASLVLSPWLLAPWVWGTLLAGTSAALLLALPRRLYSWQVARALGHLPQALAAMVKALLQLKKAKTSFLPTPHAARPPGLK